MFDIGWSEMLVIAVVMIVVVGPKDLPKMLRTFGRTTAKMRAMAGDFRKQFDDALKEAELDDVKSTIDSVRQMNPASDLKKALNPMEKAAADVRAGLDAALKPRPPAPAAAPVTHAAEPLKTGPAAMPGAAPAAAEAAPPAPVATPSPEIAPAVAPASVQAPAPAVATSDKGVSP